MTLINERQKVPIVAIKDLLFILQVIKRSIVVVLLLTLNMEKLETFQIWDLLSGGGKQLKECMKVLTQKPVTIVNSMCKMKRLIH